MTKPANSPDKASPSDTPTNRPPDNGGESKVRKEDKTYSADEPGQDNIAGRREKEEQPVESIKNPPKEEGMDEGKVQP